MISVSNVQKTMVTLSDICTQCTGEVCCPHYKYISIPFLTPASRMKKRKKKKKSLCVHSDTETTSTDSHNIHSSTDLINMLWHCHRYYHFIELLAHNEDCPCQTGPQSLGHDLQLCSLFREARQKQSPQSMFYSSAPSSEKPDRNKVPSSAPSTEKPEGSGGPMEQRCNNSCGATRSTF